MQRAETSLPPNLFCSQCGSFSVDAGNKEPIYVKWGGVKKKWQKTRKRNLVFLSKRPCVLFRKRWLFEEFLSVKRRMDIFLLFCGFI